jgi:hypothetical protein
MCTDTVGTRTYSDHYATHRSWSALTRTLGALMYTFGYHRGSRRRPPQRVRVPLPRRALTAISPRTNPPPRAGDLHLATSGDHDLAVDNG